MDSLYEKIKKIINEFLLGGANEEDLKLAKYLIQSIRKYNAKT